MNRLQKIARAYNLARLIAVPEGAKRLADAHEHHQRQAFVRRYAREPDERELGLMKFGFIATIEGIF